MRTALAALASMLMVTAWSGLQAQQPPPTPKIWQGVYTAAQAERGKVTFSTNCLRCHGADLAGNTAPALKGDRFFTSWGNDTVEKLFFKIRDTMPPNFGTFIDDAAKLDIVAYILQANGFPVGPRELTQTAGELAAIHVVRKGEEAVVQNFALVQTVGCLARLPDQRWLLMKTAPPTVTREDVPDQAALAAAAQRPLGDERYLLLSAKPFDPESHLGQKMEARGLIYRDGSDARLTVTSLKPLGAPCP